MRSTIDGAGRVVVPKAMRDRLGIGTAAEIEIELRDGLVVIAPASRDVTIGVGDDGQPVLVAPEDTGVLTTPETLDLIDETRAWPRS